MSKASTLTTMYTHTQTDTQQTVELQEGAELRVLQAGLRAVGDGGGEVEG